MCIENVCYWLKLTSSLSTSRPPCLLLAERPYSRIYFIRQTIKRSIWKHANKCTQNVMETLWVAPEGYRALQILTRGLQYLLSAAQIIFNIILALFRGVFGTLLALSRRFPKPSSRISPICAANIYHFLNFSGLNSSKHCNYIYSY
jgi:hypothetical protein